MVHGAMVSEEYEESEGEILRRCRKLVGPDIPIFVTLDLHGNITPADGRPRELPHCGQNIPAHRLLRNGMEGRRSSTIPWEVRLIVNP